MNLFKGKKFEVKVVPDDKPSVAYYAEGDTFVPPQKPEWVLTPDDFIEVITNTAITVGVVYAGARVIDTLCRISVIVAKAKFK